ncbi:hypothetical protein CMQ_7391 [Grosmannia clavigera kw1407]|uniref:Xylanolytic transcriptional activator regulatory domain-containing protein n=1 Tax=Grosmannia clavigera (strain kw1407 / UAMH 11150) TaxID=655863 RepID=F0XQ26_GROCL|nr:uncharacterized protein CMQ_7391 [Grosmannia clavigera kw1407]EFX00389.1 hypothetical protein CMQ_7391 [Grosmannia clavigera kw1407]
MAEADTNSATVDSTLQTRALMYIGDSATLSYLNLFRRMVESINGVSDFTGDTYKEKITIGLVDIFDKQRFREDFDTCYSNPLSANNHFLCLLFLTFAIGLVMATPEPGTREEAVIRHLRGGNADEQAELFFRSAKRLGDPLNGFEDADFWSIQALSLMSVYMLSVSKRNAAFAYHEAALQDDIEHCMPSAAGFTAASFSAESPEEQVHSHGMNASVIRDIRQQCDSWTQNLPDCLRWQRLKQPALHNNINSGYPSHAHKHGLAVLHVNLLHYHSIILLTRPFFLFLIQKDHRGPVPSQPRARTEKFSEVCVAASYQTISMVQSAREAMCLPQRNPFVINEFVVLFYTPSYGVAIKKAISIMEYFSTNDQQAARLLWILRALQDVVLKQANDGVAATGSINPSRYSYHMGVGNDSAEPFCSILARASVSTMDNSEAGGSSHWQDRRGRNSSVPCPWYSFQSQSRSHPLRNESVAAYGVGTGAPRNTQVLTPSQESHSGPTGHFGATTVQPLSSEGHPPIPLAPKPPTYRQGQQHLDGSIYEPVGSGPTETLDTDTDDLDFECLYDWSGGEGTEVERGGSSTADTVVAAVSSFSPGTPQRLVLGANCEFPTPQSTGRFERDDVPKTPPHPPLQPVYSDYTMHASICAGGWNTTGPSASGTTMPHDVSLYRTTDTE